MNAASVAPSHTAHALRLWLWWVAATILGWCIGGYAGSFLGYLLLGNGIVVWILGSGTRILLGNVLLALGIGVGVGLLQWLVLKAELPHSGGWAPAGAVGLLLPVGLACWIWGEPSDLGWLVVALAGGALAGVRQRRILRRALAHSWWWAPASAAGWSLGLLGYGVTLSVGGGGPSSPLLAAFNAMVIPAIPAGLLLGAITGGALVALLCQPAPGAATLDTPAEAPRRTAWQRLLLAALVIVALTLVVFTLPYAGMPLAYWDLSQRILADDVRGVAFSPDGTLLVAASPFGGMQVWDAASGTPHDRQRRVTGSVEDLAWSPDGRLLATARSMASHTPFRGPAELWNAATGDRVRTLRGQGVSRVVFSPDGALLAGTMQVEGITAQLWEVATGKPVRTLLGTAWVGDIAFSPDGALLATAGDDWTARLWEVDTGAAVQTLKGHRWIVRGVAFSPDGATLASASFDGTVKLWDVATGKELRSIPWPETP
ncbi:MAG: WD40 repeat domain-containing protein [Chloroflexales bacterium]|nr:WD40 repeat domain-containing protein [Chloroflexales bacterium]